MDQEEAEVGIKVDVVEVAQGMEEVVVEVKDEVG